MNLISKAMKSIVWNSIGNYVRFIVNFLGQLLLIRLLLPEDFGVFAFVVSVVELLSFLIGSGFSIGIIQMPDEDGLKDTAFWLTIGQSLIYFILLLIASIFVGIVYPKIALIILVMGLARVLAPIAQVYIAHLQKKLLFKSISVSNMFSGIFSIICAIILAKYGCGVWSLVLKELIDRLVILFVYKNISGWRVSKRFNKNLAKRLFSFGVKIYCTGWLERLAFRIDAFIGGFLMKSNMLGFYSQARYLTSLPVTAVVPLMGTALFSIYSNIQNEDNKIREVCGLMNFFLIRLILPISCILFLFPSEIVTFLFGEKWRISATAVRWLAFYPLFSTLFENQKLLLQGKGDLSKPSVILLIQILLTILFFIYGFKNYGFSGCAIGYIVSIFIGWFIAAITTRHYMLNFVKGNITPFAAIIVSTLFIELIRLYCTFYFLQSAIIRSIFFVLMYFLILIIFERKFLFDLISRIYNHINSEVSPG